MNAFHGPRFIVAASAALAALFPLVALAQGGSHPSFSDVPTDHPEFNAIEYLKAQGIVSGYDDGTFKPDQLVNRAEALKLIMAPRLSDEQIASLTSSPFNDVPKGAWFLPYVEAARQGGVVDGPPAKTVFNGSSTVIKAEFLKMLQIADGADPNGSYSEIRLPLAKDIADVGVWYYPYLRFALTSSLASTDADGFLSPSRELTRSDTAGMLYEFLRYKEDHLTQELIDKAETEIFTVLNALKQNDLPQAELASARALLAARGAHTSRPDEPIVQGALKTTEAFRALVRAYRAGSESNYEEVVRLSGDAWNLASRVKELAPELQSIAEQVQSISKGMADEARGLLGEKTN